MLNLTTALGNDRDDMFYKRLKYNTYVYWLLFHMDSLVIMIKHCDSTAIFVHNLECIRYFVWVNREYEIF